MTLTVRVIMPIGSDPRFHAKRTAIDQGARAASFAPFFPEYNPASPHFDLRVALKQFQSSTVVLADLTNERPSCYYELGLAEAVGTPVVLIAAKGTSIHQSSFRDSVCFYSNISELSKVTEAVLHKFVVDNSVTA